MTIWPYLQSIIIYHHLTQPYKDEEEALMGLKVVSVRANNALIGKSLVPANILLLNAETGEVNSMVAATYLTAARTAAGSAIATEICLNHKFKYDGSNDNDDNTEENSTSSQQLHLVVVGAGLQIELHIRYLSHLLIMKHKLNKITIVNRSSERAQTLKDSMQTFFNGTENNHYKDTESEENHTNRKVNIDTARISPIQINCLNFKDEIKVKEAIASASVIVTGTNTASPLFNWDWVSPGCHINGVGSYQSETEEVCSTFIKERCLTIVDTIDALQVGDLKEISDDSDDDGDDDVALLGTLGDLMAGDVSLPPRSEVPSKHCTFYKSVGTAIQDIITANEVVRSAKSQSIGTNVDMS
jgi:ornithine cyclodeaminase/alanine dehydrogenase-like protein (mu-crystallin family)